MKRYEVRAGAMVLLYYTDYHAEQMARALALHGMDVLIIDRLYSTLYSVLKIQGLRRNE